MRFIRGRLSSAHALLPDVLTPYLVYGRPNGESSIAVEEVVDRALLFVISEVLGGTSTKKAFSSFFRYPFLLLREKKHICSKIDVSKTLSIESTRRDLSIYIAIYRYRSWKRAGMCVPLYSTSKLSRGPSETGRPTLYQFNVGLVYNFLDRQLSLKLFHSMEIFVVAPKLSNRKVALSPTCVLLFFSKPRRAAWHNLTWPNLSKLHAVHLD